MITWSKKITLSLVDFLTIQLFINLVTWPLFLWWGLSITPLSIIGNLVFSPFLTVFLLIASLITICELIGIPNSPLIWVIELLTNIWLKLTGYGPNYAVAFVQPNLLLALCVPLCTIAVIKWKKISTSSGKLVGLCSIYLFFAGIFCLTRTPEKISVPYGSHNVVLKKQGNKIRLIDSGFIRRSGSISTWINYTLLPELAKNFGVQRIDQVILEKNNPSAIRCAKLLHQKGYTREIIYKNK